MTARENQHEYIDPFRATDDELRSRARHPAADENYREATEYFIAHRAAACRRFPDLPVGEAYWEHIDVGDPEAEAECRRLEAVAR